MLKILDRTGLGAGTIAPPLHTINTDIFCVIGDTVFKLSLMADQFKYQYYLPFFQKAVYSFQMTPQEQQQQQLTLLIIITIFHSG
jgi:hypothetical protein